MFRRALVLIPFCLLSVSSNATPAFLRVFAQKYAGIPAVENGCRNCHTRPPKRNDYGKSLQSKLGPNGLTVEILASVENEDADHDGFTNLDEIKAGTLPGDPTSKPAGTPAHAPVESAPATSAAPASPPPTPPLVPEHTFHPVLVHFPIALFLFGAFLEFLGKYRKSDELHIAAGWNIAFGFVGALASILTGFIAAYRMGRGFPPSGDAYTHMLFAIGGTLLMAGTLYARKKGGIPYLVLLALAAMVIGYAGHLGGNMVFGG